VLVTHVPRKKGVGSRESGRRYREAARECASYARHLPRGERLRAYRNCLKRRLKAIEQVG